MGSPSKYKKEYCQKIIKWFSVPPYRVEQVDVVTKEGVQTIEKEVANDMPTFTGFCASIKHTRDRVHQWKKAHPEFAEAFQMAKDLQEHFFITNSLKGFYPPAIAIFTAKNILGWRDHRNPEVLVQNNQYTNELSQKVEKWQKMSTEELNDLLEQKVSSLK